MYDLFDNEVPNDENAHEEHENDESAQGALEPIEEMTNEEMQEEGFYNVQSILKHKYHQGWRFLTQWEGYPLNASTWEPTKAFKLPDGRLNSKFKEYCEEHGLSDILRRALK